MSTKSLTIHLTYIIIICTLSGMLYMQHDFFQSQAGSNSDKQNETQKKLTEMTEKFENLQTDFEALHQKKSPSEQSLYYQDRLETLEIKHNALKVICEHHKADLDNCLSAQTQASGDTSSENTHPIQFLNERLKSQNQAVKQPQIASELNQHEYDDPAKHASPETTKKAPQVELKEPITTEAELDSQPEPIKPEAATELESQPTILTPQIQSEPVKPTATDPVSQSEPIKPIATEPIYQSEPVTPANAESEPRQSATIEASETVKPPPIELTPESKTSHTNMFQCPSAETINNHLATGHFMENNINWWLDFSFRPIHSNEEVKSAYKAMLSGQYMDCYYRIGPQKSDDTINGIWIVIKGAAQNHTFLPSNAWEDCDIEGCTKRCEKTNDLDCEFGLETQN